MNKIIQCFAVWAVILMLGYTFFWAIGSFVNFEFVQFFPSDDTREHHALRVLLLMWGLLASPLLASAVVLHVVLHMEDET